MFSCLLKRVLPFALTFAVGAALGWLFTPHGAGVGFTTRLESRPAPFAYGYGRSCRMRPRNLVAETKPLLIRFIPDAHWPRGLDSDNDYAMVSVTFGADGKVQQVEPLGAQDDLAHRHVVGVTIEDLPPVWESVERAARQILFDPEMINGMPVSVTKEVKIHFIRD